METPKICETTKEEKTSFDFLKPSPLSLQDINENEQRSRDASIIKPKIAKDEDFVYYFF